MLWSSPDAQQTRFHSAPFGDGLIQLDVARPDLGAAYSKDVPLGSLLKISLPGASQPEPLLDNYCRGNDLVATYAQSRERLFRPQVYWRLHAGDLPTLELIVSAQTNLLDAEVDLCVGSELATGDLATAEQYWWTAEGNWQSGAADLRIAAADSADSPVLLYRGVDGWSYAEFIFPSDFVSVETNRIDGRWATRWKFFSLDMEKGVIRRSRIFAVLLPGDGDLAAALALRQRMNESPLPLTT